MTLTRFALLNTFSILLLCATPARAASFNCNDAKRPIEVAICSDPELSSADESLSEAYHSLLNKLTIDGAKKLTKVQRQFIKNTRGFCERVDANSLVLCTKHHYIERISLLKSLDRSGLPITLNGKFEPWKSDEEAGIDAIWPEIDAPEELARKFNEIINDRIISLIPDEQSDRNYELTFRIDYLNDGLISINFMSSYLPSAGWPMANYSWDTVNFLPKMLREPTSDDFFKDNLGWIDLVRIACEKEYAKSGITVEVGINAREWAITPSGVTFSCGDKIGVRGPIPQTTLSWDDLRPWLKTDAPLPHP